MPARRAGQRKARPAITVPPGWRLDRGGRSISLTLRTEDFLEALELFGEVGKVAEELEHHPDLHLTRYNRVRIATWSHDVGRLTQRDRRLAARINELLQRRSIHRHARA